MLGIYYLNSKRFNNDKYNILNYYLRLILHKTRMLYVNLQQLEIIILRIMLMLKLSLV